MLHNISCVPTNWHMRSCLKLSTWDFWLSKRFGFFIISVIRFLDLEYSSVFTKYKSKQFPFTNWSSTICVYHLAFLEIVDWVFQDTSYQMELSVMVHAYNPAIRRQGKEDLWIKGQSGATQKKPCFKTEHRNSPDLIKEKKYLSCSEIGSTEKILVRT